MKIWYMIICYKTVQARVHKITTNHWIYWFGPLQRNIYILNVIEIATFLTVLIFIEGFISMLRLLSIIGTGQRTKLCDNTRDKEANRSTRKTSVKSLERNQNCSKGRNMIPNWQINYKYYFILTIWKEYRKFETLFSRNWRTWYLENQLSDQFQIFGKCLVNVSLSPKLEWKC